MAAVVVWRRRNRRNLRRNRLFRDRKNPLDMYDDAELYDKFRFRRHDILAIVDELREDLEYPDTRQGSLPATLQVLVALRMYATGCFQNLVAETIGISQRHREPSTEWPTLWSLGCKSGYTAADATTSRPAEGQVPPAGRISQRRGMHRRDPRPHPGASHQRTWIRKSKEFPLHKCPGNVWFIK